MSRKKQFQSKEAKAVARANEKFDLITHTIEELDDVIQDLNHQGLTASKQRKKELKEEKKLYEAKRNELKVQEKLNKAKDSIKSMPYTIIFTVYNQNSQSKIFIESQN